MMCRHSQKKPRFSILFTVVCGLTGGGGGGGGGSGGGGQWTGGDACGGGKRWGSIMIITSHSSMWCSVVFISLSGVCALPMIADCQSSARGLVLPCTTTTTLPTISF